MQLRKEYLKIFKYWCPLHVYVWNNTSIFWYFNPIIKSYAYYEDRIQGHQWPFAYANNPNNHIPHGIISFYNKVWSAASMDIYIMHMWIYEKDWIRNSFKFLIKSIFCWTYGKILTFPDFQAFFPDFSWLFHKLWFFLTRDPKFLTIPDFSWL